MRKKATLLFFAILCFARVFADPYIGSLYPAGAKAGESVRVIVAGQRLGGLIGGSVSGEGVTVSRIDRVPSFPVANGKGQRAWLEKWIYSIRKGQRAMPSREKVTDVDLAGWTRCTWWETMDQLGDIELAMVARNLFTPRNPLQMSPSLSEHAVLTIDVDPNAPAGPRSLYLYNYASSSAPKPFVITTERHVAEPLFTPPIRKGKAGAGDPPAPKLTPQSLPVVFDGQIMPGETDAFPLLLKAGDNLTCLLTGRELTPYLGDAVPGFFNPVLSIKDEAGRELAFADDYGYLPDPVLTCKIERTGLYRLEVRDNLYRGREDFVYSVVCRNREEGELPTVSERAFAVAAKSENENGETGTIARSGEPNVYDFEIERPGKWSFELFARRQGSSLDGVLKLYGPVKGWLFKSAPLLATWDDVTNETFVGTIPQAECDPAGTWDFSESGTYRLSVEDRLGLGGDDCFYTLVGRPCEPSFELYTDKSAFVQHPWKNEAFSFKLKVVGKNGFSGKITLVGDGQYRLQPTEIDFTTNATFLVRAIHLTTAEEPFHRCSFFASAVVSPGHVVTNRIIATDEMEQAFAYTHLIPSPCLRVQYRPRDTRKATPPAWREMPCDAFLPRRVIQKHRLFSAETNTLVEAMDLCSRTEVVLAKAPLDEEGALCAKFATSAAILRSRRAPAMAFEPSAADERNALPWSVLAGFTRFVSPSLDFADGNGARVRAFANAALQPPDADILVFVPSSEADPLSGAVGRWARKLARRGFSFDFVTEKTLPSAPLYRQYRALIVPCAFQALSEETRTRLTAATERKVLKLVVGENVPKNLKDVIPEKCRRDVFPDGIRFARFGLNWGENWYFVYNATPHRVSGDCKFGMRGQPKTAYAMGVATGDVTQLKPGKGKNRFLFCLNAGESAWLQVTYRETK